MPEMEGPANVGTRRSRHPAGSSRQPACARYEKLPSRRNIEPQMSQFGPIPSPGSFSVFLVWFISRAVSIADSVMLQLLTEARAAVQRGGSKGAGERLFAAVAAHADEESSSRAHHVLTQLVAELGFADVAIFRARATATHAMRTLELLELHLRA